MNGPFEPPKRLAGAFVNDPARNTPNLGLAPSFNTGKPVEPNL